MYVSAYCNGLEPEVAINWSERADSNLRPPGRQTPSLFGNSYGKIELTFYNGEKALKIDPSSTLAQGLLRTIDQIEKSNIRQQYDDI